MGRAVNFDAVPDTSIVPDGTYRIQIAELEESASKEGKLMYKSRLEILEPEDFGNMSLFESYTIGSESDPDAQEESTWIKSFGARMLKNLLKASQVPLDNDMDNVCAAAVQAQCVVTVKQEVDDGKRDPQYAGRVRNRISNYFPLGQRELGVTGDGAAQAAPAPKPAPKPAPAAKAAAPAAKPAPRPNIPTGVQSTATAPRPTPGAPVAAAAKPAVARAAEVKCTICDTMVPRAEFANHVEAHGND